VSRKQWHGARSSRRDVAFVKSISARSPIDLTDPN
jgi:hypothetical protein